jgi:hypothetical protein
MACSRAASGCADKADAASGEAEAEAEAKDAKDARLDDVVLRLARGDDERNEAYSLPRAFEPRGECWRGGE